MGIPEKKPDIVVEVAAILAATLPIPGPTTVIVKLHLVMELKKKDGERIEDALVQLSQSILETVDSKGSKYNENFEVLAAVQCGLYRVFRIPHRREQLGGGKHSSFPKFCFPHRRLYGERQPRQQSKPSRNRQQIK